MFSSVEKKIKTFPKINTFSFEFPFSPYIIATDSEACYLKNEYCRLFRVFD